MLRQVPAIMLMAVSRFAAFRSGILVLAISSSCFFVMDATFVLLGTPEPLSIPTAFLIRTAAGGVLVMKLQEQIAWENQQKKLGKVIEVLVEDKDGLTNRYRGRSAWDAPDEVDGMVIFRSDRAIEPGTFVQVRITEVLVHDVIGVEV